MDKDDNLFEDGIKESSDLLDIDFDDLPGDVTDESKGEEDDDGIIDLIDLVEKGDAELFSDDEVIEEEVITYEPAETLEEESDKISDEKDELDDILREAGMSTPADDSGINPLEDLSVDQLTVDNLSNDSENTSSDTDITGDMFEKLLDDTVLDELSEDSEELPEDITEEFNLEPEDFSDLESVLEDVPSIDEKIADIPITSGVQGNLFSDFNTNTSAPEETHGLGDELIAEPDIFGDELNKTIASSDEDAEDKSLWEADADEDISGAETEGISILEEASSDDEKIEYSGIDSEDEGFVNLDDLQLDSKSIDGLFPDEKIISEPESVPEPVSEDLKQDLSQEPVSSFIDQPETAQPFEPVVPEIQTADVITPVEAVPPAPAETIVQPVISEEKIEEIVTKVVSEVVERVAREVFKEVAEKVISEAIEGLKKSLEAELE